MPKRTAACAGTRAHDTGVKEAGVSALSDVERMGYVCLCWEGGWERHTHHRRTAPQDRRTRSRRPCRSALPRCYDVGCCPVSGERRVLVVGQHGARADRASAHRLTPVENESDRKGFATPAKARGAVMARRKWSTAAMRKLVWGPEHCAFSAH